MCTDIFWRTFSVTGDSDRLIVPENSRMLAEGIANARLVQLSDAAHFFWIEKHQESAAALIDFFGGL